MLIDKRGDLILDGGWVGNGHNGGGCKCAMTADDMNNLVSQWKHGESHGTNSIENAITQTRENIIMRSGGVRRHCHSHL